VAWAVKLWQAFGRLYLDIGEPVVSGGCLIARWQASGIGKRSGIPVDMGGYCMFLMRRAKVSRVEFFETERAALDAARRLRATLEGADSHHGGFDWPPQSRAVFHPVD
jgi:hypothetical protein